MHGQQSLPRAKLTGDVLWAAVQSALHLTEVDHMRCADIHDPYTTVHEALLFCAHLRINNPPDSKAVDNYVEEVCLS